MSLLPKITMSCTWVCQYYISVTESEEMLNKRLVDIDEQLRVVDDYAQKTSALQGVALSRYQTVVHVLAQIHKYKNEINYRLRQLNPVEVTEDLSGFGSRID